MARPKKPGLDYFPKDTNIYSDRKIKRLKTEFGAKGLLIFDYLLCLIYQDKGYYLDHNEDLDFDVADVIGCGVTEDEVKDVILCCVKVGLFDKRVYVNMKCLTSSGIQKRYIYAKRGGVISESIRVFTAKTPVNATKTPVNVAKSTQSKVKQSKVKQSKEEKKKIKEKFTPQPDVLYPVAKLKEYYLSQDRIITAVCTGNGITEIQLRDFLKKFTDELFQKGRISEKYKEYAAYFLNWLKCKIEKEKSCDKKEKTSASKVFEDLILKSQAS